MFSKLIMMCLWFFFLYMNWFCSYLRNLLVSIRKKITGGDHESDDKTNFLCLTNLIQKVWLLWGKKTCCSFLHVTCKRSRCYPIFWQPWQRYTPSSSHMIHWYIRNWSRAKVDPHRPVRVLRGRAEPLYFSETAPKGTKTRPKTSRDAQ